MLNNGRSLSVIVFALFFSWLLAFPFEGQVLYAVANYHGTTTQSLTFVSVAAHFSGLFCCGFFIKSVAAAKRFMAFSIAACIIGTLVFFFPPSMLWNISILVVSMLSGAGVAAWGYYFRKYTPSRQRIKTAADVLIFSNILMIVLNSVAILISPQLGLILAILMLVLALYVQLKLSGIEDKAETCVSDNSKKTVSPAKPLAFLCLFVVVITVNSGLMYRVVNPAFAHLEWLVSWYWAIPYIAALYIVKNLSDKTNRNYMLYVAIAMIGLSFIGFMILDRSAASYILIDTLMLGACGVYDLFWWSILGEMLDFHDNPAKILGIGLSSNVLGILIGGALGNVISAPGADSTNPTVLALVIVLVTLLILPLLHKHLTALLKDHVFLTQLYELPVSKQDAAIESFARIDLLTERESEIAALLLKGRTYKMIAGELYLSENTIKTHVKNIYSKFNIKSKVELVKLLMQDEDFKV